MVFHGRISVHRQSSHHSTAADPPQPLAQLVEGVVLHQTGQTVAQIAKRFDFHRTTVARYLKQARNTPHTAPTDPAFQERVRQACTEIGTLKHNGQSSD